MKKAILSIVAILGCGLLTSCGLGTLGTTGTTTGTSTTGSTDVLGAVAGSLLSGNSTSTSSSTSVLSNIISTFASGITTSQSTIVGTWTYTQPCVQFESENLLAQAGGSVIASSVESKLATYYSKIGIKQGSCTFTFGSDNSLQYTIGGKQRTGTYSFNSSNKTVTITTQLGGQVTAYVSISGSTMGLTFDVSKLLTLLQTGAASSSQLSSISSIASNYSGMKAGFQFSK